MDKQKFKQACDKILVAERVQKGIGTLGEKTLHAVLKQYFEPDISNHEIKIGSFVADIVTESGIIEIQTRSFDKLRRKLREFLETYPVTVVFPIAKTKWLMWIDQETGELSKKRKSPKQGQIYDVAREISKIKHFLPHPHFQLCIALINMEEYRHLDGWSKDKKRGSTRFERVPIDIIEEIYLNEISGYIRFLPEGLEPHFTSKDYMNATKADMRTSQAALNILNHIGIVERIGKQGNRYIYQRHEII